MSKRLAVVAACLAMLFPALALSQANYPTHPIKILVGFAPGGGSPEDFEKFLKTELAKYSRLVKEAKISIN